MITKLTGGAAAGVGMVIEEVEPEMTGALQVFKSGEFSKAASYDLLRHSP